MKHRGFSPLHPWDITPRDAVSLQQKLANSIVRVDDLEPVHRVAGVDVGFDGHESVAAVAVLGFPGLQLLDQAVVRAPVTFPYVPGLLSFREVPIVLEALSELETLPDLVLCDGQGIAHPRRIGYASHLGLAAGLPTIGVAKTRLIGGHGPLPVEKGAQVALEDREEMIGAVLRTRAGVAPLFISIGHRVSLGTAIDFVLACTTRYRLPETTRWAHRLASGSSANAKSGRAAMKTPRRP